MKSSIPFFISLILISLFFVGANASVPATEHPTVMEQVATLKGIDENDWDYCGLEAVVCENELIFEITAFNTVPEQTDNSPCISASGDNICGRTDVVACPRKYPLGTIFQIDGKDYICLDRLADKYNNRIDISFDKDIVGARQFGKQTKQVIIK